MSNDHSYFKMPVHDIFSLMLNEHIKKFFKFKNRFENILLKYSLFLSDVLILDDGVEERINIEPIATYKNAKMIILFGHLSVKKFLENLDKIDDLQYLYILDVNQTIDFPPQFKKLKKLSTLILQNNTFKALPDSIQNLENLTELEINNCCYLDKLPKKIIELNHLQHLEISNCQGFRVLPPEIADLKKIYCIHFINLPNLKSIFEIKQGQLSQLGMFDIINCPELKELPDSFNLLGHLEYIKICGCYQINLKKDQFKKLQKLSYLTLDNCVGITQLSLPDLTLNFLSIEINNCVNIMYDDIVIDENLNRYLSYKIEMNYQDFCDRKTILKTQNHHQKNALVFQNFALELNGIRQNIQQIHPKLFALTALTHLVFNDFDCLSTVPKEIATLKNLKYLTFNKWVNLKAIPIEIFQLKNLIELKVIRSYKLKNLPSELAELYELRILDLSGCNHLESLTESIGQLKKLKELRLARCEKLKCLPDSVRFLDQLEYLHLSGCIHLTQLPDFTRLKKLVVLHLSGCTVSELPTSMKHLRQLEVLHLSGCIHLKKLPLFLLELSYLEEIFISGCCSLQNLDEFEKHNKHIKIIQRKMIG